MLELHKGIQLVQQEYQEQMLLKLQYFLKLVLIPQSQK